MEPITLASLVTSLVIKASEKGAEKLGESSVEKIGHMIRLILGKLRGNNQALAVLSEKTPSQEQKAAFIEILEAQIIEDRDFESQLASSVEDIRKDALSSQVLLRDIFAKNGIKVGDVTQYADSDRSSFQEAATNLETDGVLEIKSLNQEIR